jgi:hypothetical protein
MFAPTPAGVYTAIDESVSAPNRESYANDHEQGNVMFTSLNEKPDGKVTEKQHSDNKPQAADEEAKAGAEDSSHETGVECYECLDPVQNCPPPDSGFPVLYRQNLHEQK